MSIPIELLRNNWRSQCEYVKAGSGCFALTDPQKEHLVMQMKLKWKQTQEIMLPLQNYDVIFFTDDCDQE